MKIPKFFLFFVYHLAGMQYHIPPREDSTESLSLICAK